MYAAFNNGAAEVVEALLDAGADPTLRGADGEDAWGLIQQNSALRGTDVYWELNDRRFE